jgi:hypothetical protein
MQRIRWWSAAVLSAAVGVTGCGGGSSDDSVSSERSLAQSQEQNQQPEACSGVPRKIFPVETDQEIDWVPLNNAANAQHHVWVPAPESENGKLFIFMPGTGNKPADYTYFSAEAARAGYHVIGLMYQNDKAIEMICPVPPGNSDENCSGDMRLEVLTGAAISDNVTVSVANSIDYRLTKLLVHLDRECRHEGWSRFLKKGEPKWSRIAVGGQSQGAGQAALIAQLRRVPRVVMLSGPPDSRIPNQVPPVVDNWVHIGETRASRHFALYHHQDRFVRGPPTGTTGITTNLTALGLDQFGAPVAVGNEGPYCTTDDLGSPSDSSFGNTRLLVTDLVPQGGCGGANPGNPHRSTARNDSTPLAADGTPRLLGAWRYLLGPSEDEDGQDEVALDD